MSEKPLLTLEEMEARQALRDELDEEQAEFDHWLNQKDEVV